MHSALTDGNTEHKEKRFFTHIIRKHVIKEEVNLQLGCKALVIAFGWKPLQSSLFIGYQLGQLDCGISELRILAENSCLEHSQSNISHAIQSRDNNLWKCTCGENLLCIVQMQHLSIKKKNKPMASRKGQTRRWDMQQVETILGQSQAWEIHLDLSRGQMDGT